MKQSQIKRYLLFLFVLFQLWVKIYAVAEVTFSWLSLLTIFFQCQIDPSSPLKDNILRK